MHKFLFLITLFFFNYNYCQVPDLETSFNVEPLSTMTTHSVYKQVNDNNGNLIVLGSVSGTLDLDYSSNVHLISNDVFLCSYDSLGTYLWSKPFNCSNSRVVSIDVDSQNDIYVLFATTAYFTFLSTTYNPNGNLRVYILKISHSGQELNCIPLVGLTDLSPSSLEVTPNDEVIVGINGPGADFDPSPNIAISNSYAGTVAKYSTNGDLIWFYSYPNSNSQKISDVTYGKDGNIYWTGVFSSFLQTNPFDNSTLQFFSPSYGGKFFISKFDSNFNFINTTFSKTESSSTSNSIRPLNTKVDDLGNIFLMFEFNGVHYINDSVDTIHFQSVSNYDLGVLKLDSTFKPLFKILIQNNSTPLGNSISDFVLDEMSNIYLISRQTLTLGAVDINPDSTDVLAGGDYYGFLVFYDKEGNYQWHHDYYMYTNPTSISIDEVNNNLWVTTISGFGQNVDLDFTNNSYNVSSIWHFSSCSKYKICLTPPNAKLDSLNSTLQINNGCSSHLEVTGYGIPVWYDAPNGNIVNTGLYFNTPNLFSNTIYYVKDKLCNESNDYTQVEIQVSTQNITINPQNICLGSSITIGNSIYNSTGNYFDTLTSIISGCDSLVNTQLTVISLDTTVTLLNDTLFSNQLGVNYSWINCVTNQEISTLNYILPQINESYSLNLSDTICSIQKPCFTVVGLGIEQNTNNTFLISPNPTNDFFIVQYSENGPLNYSINSFSGSVIVEGIIQDKYTQIDVSNLSVGSYIIKFSNHLGIENTKILIKI